MAYHIKYRGNKVVGGYQWKKTPSCRFWLQAYFSAQLFHLAGWEQVIIEKEKK